MSIAKIVLTSAIVLSAASAITPAFADARVRAGQTTDTCSLTPDQASAQACNDQMSNVGRSRSGQ